MFNAAGVAKNPKDSPPSVPWGKLRANFENKLEEPQMKSIIGLVCAIGRFNASII